MTPATRQRPPAASIQEAIDDVYGLGLRPDLPALHARFLGWLSLARRPHH
ncbi:hypothetical protein [Micromonospora sp. NPDC049645]